MEMLTYQYYMNTECFNTVWAFLKEFVCVCVCVRARARVGARVPVYIVASDSIDPKIGFS